MLIEFIKINYASILIIIFMMTFLLSNALFDKRITKLFMISTLTVLVLVVVDSVESWTATFTYPTMLRVWMSAIGYTVRPLSVLMILMIVVRGKAWKKWLLVAPAVINGIISFTALFTGIAFSYSETNEFVRGPLGISAYVTSGIYMIILFAVTVQYIKEKNYYEGLVVLDIIVINIVSIVLEVLWKQDGLINVSIAISITFYYLYYHSQTFKRDQLTQALNRRCFYLDAERNIGNLTAVISIDLNNLKVLNDTKGHSAGDVALCTLTECVSGALLKGCRLYRTGGDEFMVLCFKQDANAVKVMVADIKERMSKTPYSCAIGMVAAEAGASFDELCKKADKAMYDDKIKMKSQK